jgi:hypothetical protein
LNVLGASEYSKFDHDDEDDDDDDSALLQNDEDGSSSISTGSNSGVLRQKCTWFRPATFTAQYVILMAPKNII